MKTFVAGIEKSTPAEESAFVKWMTDNDFGYWHWIPNFWIIQSSQDTYTVAAIRTQIKETFPAADTIVIELGQPPSVAWAGFGPVLEGHNMFAWLKRNL